MKRVVHENCVVLKFTYAGYSVMLTGDSNKPCWSASSATTRGAKTRWASRSCRRRACTPLTTARARSSRTRKTTTSHTSRRSS